MIDIHDLSGALRLSTAIGKGSKRKFSLMKEDHIVLKFETDRPVYFELGDYCETGGGVFELADLAYPTRNPSTGGYGYELRLDAPYWKWKHKILFYDRQGNKEAAWNLTRNPDAHLSVIKSNLASLGYAYKGEPYDFAIDYGVVEDKPVFLQYSNTNIIDALTMVAEACGCEWWVNGNTIFLGKCELPAEPVTFELGSNVKEMTRDRSEGGYATRVYAFGSTRNITPYYRKNLLFEATEVAFGDGCYVRDAGKPLKPEHFLESRLIPYGKSAEATGGFADTPNLSQGESASLALSTVSFGDLPAGVYKADFSGVRLEGLYGGGGTGRPKIRIATTVSCRYTGAATRTEVLEDLTAEWNFPEGQAYALSLKSYVLDGGKHRYKDVTFSVTQEVTVLEAAGALVFSARSSGKVSVESAYSQYGVSIAFETGKSAGKRYDAVVNPYGRKDGEGDFQLIKLDYSVQAVTGDKFRIIGLKYDKLPTGWFTSDHADADLVVEGIVEKRLMLPSGTPFIGDTDLPAEKVIEQVAVFEDIYPKRVGNVGTVATHPYTETKKDDKGNVISQEQWDAYRFTDSDGSFHFSKDYVIKDRDLKVTFQTGALAGMTFNVWFNPCDKEGGDTKQDEKNPDGTWNPAAQVFEIVRNEDYGRKLPAGDMKPRGVEYDDAGNAAYAGDEYVLEGFDTQFVLDAYLPAAEQELKEKAQKYADKLKADPSVYNSIMFSYEDGRYSDLPIGQKVRLVDDTYFKDGRQSRIIGFEKNLDFPYDSPVYMAGESRTYSRIGALEDKVDALTFKGLPYANKANGGSGSNVYVIKRNDNTPPGDNNVYSASRSSLEFLSKKNPDTAAELVTFAKGGVFKTRFTQEELSSAYSEAVKEEPLEGLPETQPVPLSSALTETAADGGFPTLGDLQNVEALADNAPEGAVLYKGKDVWESRFPSRWKPSVDKDGFLSFSLSETNAPPTAVLVRGEKGLSTYLHVKYSHDGKTFTENNGDTVGDWIGQYKDHTEEDSLNFDDYRWRNLKGRPWLYADFTRAQLDDLRFKFSDFTQDQLLELKGADGRTPVISLGTDYRLIVDGTKIGVPLRGVQGLQGPAGHSPVVSLNSEYKLVVDGTPVGNSLRGPQGLQGIRGLTGAAGAKGADGHSPVVSLSSDHFLTVDGTKVGTSLKGVKGDQGIQGIQGIAGHSPVVSLNSEYKLVVDGVVKSDSLRGPQGFQGIQGLTGATGAKGADGKTWLPSVDALGNLSWAVSATTTAPAARNIRGPQGIQGIQGIAGHSPVVSLNSEYKLVVDGVVKSDSLRGPQGFQGIQGLTGATGAKGADGKTWLPSVDALGNLSWAVSATTTAPAARNIRGPQGVQGRTPSVSLSNDYYLTVDGTKVGSVLRGPAGATGAKGDTPKVSLNSNYQLVVDGVAQGGSLRGPAGSDATVTAEAVRAAITSMQDTGTHVSIKSDGLSIYNSYCTNVCSMTASATIPLASSSQLGLMSSTDKSRLDTVYAWGNHALANYVRQNDYAALKQVMPELNNTYDLGTPSYRWHDIFCNMVYMNHNVPMHFGTSASYRGSIGYDYNRDIFCFSTTRSVLKFYADRPSANSWAGFGSKDPVLSLDRGSGATIYSRENPEYGGNKFAGYFVIHTLSGTTGAVGMYSDGPTHSLVLKAYAEGSSIILQTAGGANSAEFNNGNFYIPGSFSGSNVSDPRLKKNIIKVADAIKKLKSLGGVYEFDYSDLAMRKDPGLPRHSIGLMADKVQASFLAGTVKEGADGYLGINYLSPQYISLAMAVGLELDGRVSNHDKKFRSIETRHSRLEKKIKSLEKEVDYLKSIINH